jgi:hypothetical protein
MLRILIIEDDPDREQRLRSWLPSDMTPVVARSERTAIVALEMSKRWNCAGIVLHHGLEKLPASESDRFLCSRDVVNAVIRYVSKDVPILIHSVNETQVPVTY